MTTENALHILQENQAQLRAMQHAMFVLYIDGETVAPAGSAAYRAKSMGVLSGMMYDLTTNKDAIDALDHLMGVRDSLDPVMARHVSELYRDLDMTRKIPKDEASAFTVLRAEAGAVWHEAKVKNDFAMFEPYLEKVFDSMKKRAAYLDPHKDPYEVTMDLFERGLTKDFCDKFFGELRTRLVPVIRKVSRAPQPDMAPLKNLLTMPEQRKLSDGIMAMMGIDPNYCTLGETEHPFTANVNKCDVRITTHYYEDNFLPSLYSVIHEGGHALYELHVGDNLVDTCLAGGCSMAIHESQSRFYENFIGRSRVFAKVLYDYINENFDNKLKGINAEELYRMLNRAEPSLIRTEADELTYCLHIMIRYELERKLFDGSLSVHDLPKAWKDLYQEYLGVDVPDDRCGVLQDSHWSNANIGYFPSYAIGSAYGAQYLDEMRKEFDPYEAVSRGDFSKVNAWMEDKIWKHGCLYNPGDLFRSVCGEFKPSVYADYLEHKFTGIYS